MNFHKSIIRLFSAILILCTASFLNCVDVPRDNPADKVGGNYDSIYSDNRITEFRFGDLQVDGVINDEENIIVVPVLYGSDVTAIAPEFTTNAESVTVDSREQRSGITANDFSEPLVYTVTARDGSWREYTVWTEPVIIASFSLSDPALSWDDSADGIIDHDLKTITVNIPYYMDIANLIASFESAGDVYENETIQASGITEKDFSGNTYIYHIADENGVTQDYTVTVEYKDPEVAHFAGSLGGMGTSDGIGQAASFRLPYGITSDLYNLYVADTDNHTIRKIEISTGTVTTIAGSPGQDGHIDSIGADARFNGPSGIATDGVNLYVCDHGTIRKIVISTGAVTTIAGIYGTTGYVNDDDGYTSGISSTFSNLTGITTDGLNLYVADTFNSIIRQIVISSGVVSTIAGSPGIYDSVDDLDGTTVTITNPVTNGIIDSRFSFPEGITTDGTNIYVCDTSNSSIRQIEIESGIVTTLPGTIMYPVGIATDNGNLYITDAASETIHKIIISTGALSTIAGYDQMTGYADGMGAAARFSGPKGITIRDDILYVNDSSNGTIRRISPDLLVDTFAGLVNYHDSIDDTGTDARFYYPYEITTDGTNLYVCDGSNRTIRSILISTGEVDTIAGMAMSTGSNDDLDGYENGILSQFKIPSGITNAGGNLYVSDSQNFTIRQIEISSGIVSTLAGSALAEGTANGTGASARFSYPKGIINDGTNLYVCDANNNAIRKIVILTKEVSTFAGSCDPASPGYADDEDGFTGGISSIFNQPYGITTDGLNLYVCDSYNHTIRKIVISSGAVSIIAGLAGEFGSADDPDGYTNGHASRFYYPSGITTDGVNLYISEGIAYDGNHTIRKIIISTGVVTTIAGTPELRGNTDGPGSNALFCFPRGLLFHDKKLYVCDSNNNSVRIINP